MNAFLNALKSKTVWGAVVIQGAGLAALPAIGAVDVAHAVGVVLAAAGARHAVDKAAEVIAAAQK